MLRRSYQYYRVRRVISDLLVAIGYTLAGASFFALTVYAIMQAGI